MSAGKISVNGRAGAVEKMGQLPYIMGLIIRVKTKTQYEKTRRCPMESAKITLMHHTAKVPDGSYVDEPKVVKIAMLALYLTDDTVDEDEKQLCVKAAERRGFITEEEGRQLLFYRGRLNEIRARGDENG